MKISRPRVQASTLNPVTLWSTLEPSTTMQSAACMARLAARCEVGPTQPTDSGSEASCRSTAPMVTQ
jgi:hypothetical protein